MALFSGCHAAEWAGDLFTDDCVVWLGQINTDWVGLIDEWATRFFQELDYEREARNAAVFRDQMASLGGITVAEVYENLTSREVLTTAWVQGVSSNLL